MFGIGFRIRQGRTVVRDYEPGPEVGRGQFENGEAQVFLGRACVRHLDNDAPETLFANIGDSEQFPLSQRERDGVRERFWQLHHNEAPLPAILAVQFQHRLRRGAGTGEEI